MKKTLFLAIASASLLLAGRGASALDFAALAGPLPAAEAKAPAAPAPSPAAPKACRPFLLSLAVGGVDETVVLERACTAENEPVWAILVESRSARVSVKVSSDKYPAERAALEKRIKGMALQGIGQEDAEFIVMKTGPALRKAAAAPKEDQAALLAGIQEALKVFLAR